MITSCLKQSLPFKTEISLLNPLLQRQIPEAIYLASCISEEKETQNAFEMRSFSLLNQAAQLGHAQSIYLLGVQYECGNGVMKSHVIASAFFERAAALGHSRAKLSHGLDLVHGSNRIPQDTERGLACIRQAVVEGVEGAAEIFDDLSPMPKLQESVHTGSSSTLCV